MRTIIAGSRKVTDYAVVEELGVTWELVDHVSQVSDVEIDQGCEGCQGQLAAEKTAYVLATLLSAAGVRRHRHARLPTRRHDP